MDKQTPRVKVRRRFVSEERAKRFLERIGYSLDDIDRPGFGLADPWTGRSLIDRTAPKRPIIKDKKERLKRFLESVGKDIEDIDKPGFCFVDRVTGRSLIDRTAPKRPRLSKKERAKKFRESIGIDVSDIGKDGFYLVDRYFGRPVMENPPDSFITKVWRRLYKWLGTSKAPR